jgi:outer membrane lipoprotein SlyB
MKLLHAALMGTAGLAVLAGCATPPAGPTVAVMPGPNKNFDAFQADQAVCTSYASQAVGGQPQVANDQAVGGAVLGTVLGAGLGAAAGGGPGAAIGAASGAVAGTALGAGYSGASNYDSQQRYNIAYAQCMKAKGNNAPTSQAAYGPPEAGPGYAYPAGYYGGYYPYGYYGAYWPVGLGWGWGGCCWGGWYGGWGWHGGWGWRGGWGGWHGGWGGGWHGGGGGWRGGGGGGHH